MDERVAVDVCLQAIAQRHSVRDFTTEKIHTATVQQLLAAAVQAPTAMHAEPWEFVVVQDVPLLKQLSDLAKPAFIDELLSADMMDMNDTLDLFLSDEFNIFYNAGTLIVIGSKLSEVFTAADCWLAAENLMLAACSLGFGTCVIGSAVIALNKPEIKQMLGLPAEFTSIAPIIVGVPASGAGVPSERKPPRIVAWK